MQKIEKLGCGICLAALLALTGCGGGSVKYHTTIRYTLDAVRGLPPGMKTVAVLPAELGPATDPIWSDLAGDIIEERLRDAEDQGYANLVIVDRREVVKVMDEANLQAAGLVESDSPGALPKMKDLDAIIVSKLNIKVDVQEGESQTIDYLDIGAISRGRGGVHTSSRKTVARTMTVNCTFKLLDARTNQVWDSWSVREQGTDEESPSPFFGSNRSVADLTPQDKIIGTLVEKCAAQFINRLMPADYETEVSYKSSGSELGQAGGRAMAAGMYAEALENFKAALAENPDDDRAAFGAGVASEKLGDYEQALSYYKKACMLDDDEVYIEARRRLEEHLGRIRGQE